MSARDYMAQKLREAREAKGLTQKEVGDAVGRSFRTVSAWERSDGAQPDADMLIMLCVLYEVPISYFYEPKYQYMYMKLDGDEDDAQ